MNNRFCLPLIVALLLTPAFAQSTASPAQPTMPTTSTSTRMNMTGQMSSATSMRPVNVNTATLAQLERIPGMTPKLAQAVLTARTAGPFKNEQDFVKRVKGVGTRNVKRFEKYLSFGA